MNPQEQLIDELRERIARLEASKPRRRAYNMTEAAAELNMSVSKLRAEQKAGRIKSAQKNGRVWVFTNQAIEDYLTTIDDQ